ncbi:CCA tRNA nucleotidyltransferase [Chloroflexota bacterium]
MDKKNLKLFIESDVLLLLTKLSNFLTEQDIKSYVVGGFVRDVLLEKDTADIDIAVVADALEIAPRIATALGGKYVLLDRINGIGRVILASNGGISTQGQWNLDFSTVKGSIEQDLARRDFTIDAIAIELGQLGQDGTDVQLIDSFNGWDDLRQGVIRAVTENAFESDALRLLRAVRLAVELGFSIEKKTEVLIQRYSYLIASVAGERVREELLRLLTIPQTGRLLPYLDKLGLITAMMPEMAQAKGVEQPKEHFWNVFDHSLKTVTAVDFVLRQEAWPGDPGFSNEKYTSEEILATVPWSPELVQHFGLEVSSGSTRRLLLKLAALLHDVAKPQTKAIDARGRMRFLGHTEEGAAVTATILERLRFSTKEIKQVETMVKYHLRPVQMSHNGLPSNKAIYRYFRDAGEAGIDIIFLSLADHLAARGPQLNMTQWQEHTQMVDYMLTQHFEQEALVAFPKLIDGHDLINIFGMSPGPRIGEFLEQVRETQASGELVTKEEAISYIREHLSLTGGR